MNPFRYIPRMFFTVLLFIAAPLLFDLFFADDPTAGIDCDHPRTGGETRICSAQPNLAEAQKKIIEGLENLRAARE